MRSVLSLAKALSRMGVKVHVVTNKSSRAANVEHNDGIVFHRIALFKNARTLIGAISFSISLLKKLYELKVKTTLFS